jgi:hypothetical protein
MQSKEDRAILSDQPSYRAPALSPGSQRVSDLKSWDTSFGCRLVMVHLISSVAGGWPMSLMNCGPPPAEPLLPLNEKYSLGLPAAVRMRIGTIRWRGCREGSSKSSWTTQS